MSRSLDDAQELGKESWPLRTLLWKSQKPDAGKVLCGVHYTEFFKYLAKMFFNLLVEIKKRFC